MADRERPVPPFWIPEMDRKGRPIRKELYEAAARLWPRAYFLTLRELNDDSGASTIFESAVFSVSNVLIGMDVRQQLTTWMHTSTGLFPKTRQKIHQGPVDSIRGLHRIIEYRRQSAHGVLCSSPIKAFFSVRSCAIWIAVLGAFSFCVLEPQLEENCEGIGDKCQ